MKEIVASQWEAIMKLPPELRATLTSALKAEGEWGIPIGDLVEASKKLYAIVGGGVFEIRCATLSLPLKKFVIPVLKVELAFEDEGVTWALDREELEAKLHADAE